MKSSLREYVKRKVAERSMSPRLNEDGSVSFLVRGSWVTVDANWAFLANRRWWLRRTASGPYVLGNRPGSGKRGKTEMIHRVIMNPPASLVVDHRNGDTLDNREANLRVCTSRENVRNSRRYSNATSRFKGVTKCGAKWRAQICVDYKKKNLGYYASEESAARAYDAAAGAVFGEFAALNFPKVGPSGTKTENSEEGGMASN